MGAFATQTSTVNAATAIAFAGSTVTFTNIADASVQDGFAFANAVFAGLDYTEYCDANQFKTWPAFRADDTITGLECQVYAIADKDSACRVTHCILTDAGGVYAGSSDVAATKPIKDSWDYSIIGGDGEMWGFTSAQLKTYLGQKFQGFKFSIEEETGSAVSVDVDGMFMVVYYDHKPRLRCLMGVGI
jgi:hypothetical protein